jgi:hypothetical protein
MIPSPTGFRPAAPFEIVRLNQRQKLGLRHHSFHLLQELLLPTLFLKTLELRLLGQTHLTHSRSSPCIHIIRDGSGAGTSSEVPLCFAAMLQLVYICILMIF